MGCERKERPLDAWIMKACPDNRGIIGHWERPTYGNKRSSQMMWIDDGCERNNFVLMPHLTFPRKHLSYVEGRITIALGEIGLDKRAKHE